MNPLRAAIAVSILLAPALVSAQPVATTAPQEDASARKAMALELAQLVEPREGAGDAATEAQYVAGLLAMPEMAELEAEHPGIVKVMWRAIAPQLERDADAALPGFWATLADIYSRGMTLAQLQQSVEFMGSPTGRKMIRLMNEGLVAPAIKLGVESADGDLSAGALQEAKTTAAEAMARGMSQKEQEEITAFASTPAGRAFLALGPQVQQATVEWMNRSDPEADARLEALTTKAMEDFIAASEPAKGKGKRKR